MSYTIIRKDTGKHAASYIHTAANSNPRMLRDGLIQERLPCLISQPWRGRARA